MWGGGRGGGGGGGGGVQSIFKTRDGSRIIKSDQLTSYNISRSS